MAIKLNNLSKWQQLQEGNAIVLRGASFRKVKLQINTEAPVAIMATELGAEYFLGTVNGLQSIEFYADGEVEVAPADGTVGLWYWSDDGDDPSHQLDPDSRLFVKPLAQEQVSPAMQELQDRLHAKYQSVFQQQQENNARLWAQVAQERQAHAEAIAAAAAAAAAAQESVDDDTGADGEERTGAGSDAT